ncbi:MAG TPA: sugar transferase [Terriglobia bacterium]|nr:sugar transferase [Terriglobia bacterium]
MSTLDPLDVEQYATRSALLEAERPLLYDELEAQSRVSPAQRCFEIAVAAVALTLSLPIIVIMAIIIKLDSPGPAFFGHWRLGKGGKPFWFVKMRTLYADARERWPELYEYNYTPEELDRLYFKVPDDPRITRVGAWLRRSTLDELPNFWHVLTGEMALVGPRPEIPEMLRYYEGEERLKFSVRPGITGLAQVSGRGRLSFRETTRLDVEYVKNQSWRLDLQIILRTIRGLLTRDGAF